MRKVRDLEMIQDILEAVITCLLGLLVLATQGELQTGSQLVLSNFFQVFQGLLDFFQGVNVISGTKDENKEINKMGNSSFTRWKEKPG